MSTPREILEQVKERIVADPGKFDQRDFCGTPCCIAGHVDMIVNGEVAHSLHSSDQVLREALDAIGESGDMWLFGTVMHCERNEDENHDDRQDYWRRDLSHEYRTSATSAARALVGCKAIDRYMQERGL